MAPQYEDETGNYWLNLIAREEKLGKVEDQIYFGNKLKFRGKFQEADKPSKGRVYSYKAIEEMANKLCHGI